MPINWDTIIGGGIIIALLLAILARITNQKISELIEGIVGYFTDKGEEVSEVGETIYG